MQRDEIRIEELTVEAMIGVSDLERKNPQRLVFSIRLVPKHGFRNLHDELQRTVDYAAVVEEVRIFVRERTVKLIETLADEVAAHLLKQFELAEVEIELRKFILPETKHVSVRVIRFSTALS
ncbi:MAG: dihydroneopterin aldolase [Chthoniobacterales bacterium]